MNLLFWRKNKKQSNDEALDFLTMPAEEVKNKKKLKFDTPLEVPEIPFSEQEKMAEIEDKYLKIQPKSKKGKRKKIFQILFLVAVCGLSIFLIAKIGDSNEKRIPFSELIKSARGGWVFLAFFSFFLLVAIETLRFAYITKLTTNRLRPVVNLKVSVLGKYYDNVTPLSTGGQPFQMYYYVKKGVPAGTASAIPLIKYFITMFAMVVFSLALMIFNSKVLKQITTPGVATSVHVLAYVGVILNIALPFLILSVSIWPKFGKKLVSLILKLLKKMRIVKDYQKSYYKTLKVVEEYRTSLKIMLKKKLHLLFLILISFGEFFVLGSIPYFLCVGYGGVTPSANNWVNIMTLYAFVTNSAAFLPTPGNSGGAEVSFSLVFSASGISSGSIFWIVLLWRLITYYSYIAIGMIIVFVDFFRNTFKEKVIQRNKLINTKETVISGLNSWDVNQRQATLTVLKNIEKDDKWFVPKPREGDIKLFLKTSYSSGPYSPSALAYKCYENGSKIVGICDSETLSGAKEFYYSCSTLGMGCSIGVQVKTDLIKPKLNRRINNVYQTDIVNLSLLGIPYEKIDYVNNFLSKYRHYRSERNHRMTDLINRQYKQIGVSLDYKKDVLPISNDKEDGTVTEMHIILALCNQLVARFGKSQNLIDVLRVQMGVSIPEKSRRLLVNSVDENSFIYDLQNVLKNEIRKFYVDADKECCNITDLRKIADECQAILTYEYMGDIEQMVFGEIRAEVYEDAILDYLLKELKRLGIGAVTVSPSRHTLEQMERIRALSKELDLLVIVNETIYTRRQEIKYNEVTKDKNQQLLENSYAICGNEAAVLNNIGGFFTSSAIQKYPDINVRAAVFSDFKKMIPEA